MSNARSSQKLLWVEIAQQDLFPAKIRKNDGRKWMLSTKPNTLARFKSFNRNLKKILIGAENTYNRLTKVI